VFWRLILHLPKDDAKVPLKEKYTKPFDISDNPMKIWCLGGSTLKKWTEWVIRYVKAWVSHLSSSFILSRRISSGLFPTAKPRRNQDEDLQQADKSLGFCWTSLLTEINIGLNDVRGKCLREDIACNVRGFISRKWARIWYVPLPRRRDASAVCFC